MFTYKYEFVCKIPKKNIGIGINISSSNLFPNPINYFVLCILYTFVVQYCNAMLNYM